MNFHNAGCFDPGAQYVLLRGRVVTGAQAIQIVKKTETTHTTPHSATSSAAASKQQCSWSRSVRNLAVNKNLWRAIKVAVTADNNATV